MAQRGLTDGETLEVDSQQAIYRPTKPAARGCVDDDEAATSTAAPARRVAARRLLTDDTTTIRPSLRSFASPAMTTIIRTKHAAMPRGRKLRLAVSLVPVLAVAAIAGFAFMDPQSSGVTPVPVAAIAQASAAPIAPVATDDTSTLTPAAPAAADALAADVQAKVAAAQAADAKAAAAAGAAAQAAVAQGKPGISIINWAQYGVSAGTPVAVPDGQFIYPVKGFVISSGFGWRTYPDVELHPGVDLAVACGTPIVAAGDGVVTFAGANGGLGNYTEISHGSLSTGYGHQSKIVVTVGEQVKQGQLIGYVGSTGFSTGCHVHFQAVNPQGAVFDPRSLIH